MEAEFSLSSHFSGAKKNNGVRGRTLKFPEALDVPGYVLKHIMNGQHWPEGDATFHRRITIPVLLVYGLKDPLVSLVEMCEMERTVPKAYLELVPLAGHMVMSDCPRELNIMSQGRRSVFPRSFLAVSPMCRVMLLTFIKFWTWFTFSLKHFAL